MDGSISLRYAQAQPQGVACWTTFYWSAHFPLHAPLGWLLLQTGLTLLAISAAAWLFCHLTYANRHQRWFQWLFNGLEWQPLMQALQLLEQTAAYQPAEAAEAAAAEC